MRRLRQDRRGVAVMEFALVAPLLFLLIFGAAEFSIMLSEYLTLSNATLVGAKQFAFSAGVDSTPYTDAVAAIKTAAPTLTPLAITFSINGTGCTSDTACGTALAPGTGFVTATTTYTCANLNIVYNLLPNCTLTAQQTERVQ